MVLSRHPIPHRPIVMWQRFTEQARSAVLRAQHEATALGSDRVDTAHLLLGLLTGETTCNEVLETMGVSSAKMHFELLAGFEQGKYRVVEPKLTPQVKRVLELAADEARRMKHNYIGTEHMLVALMRASTDNFYVVLDLLYLPLLVGSGLGLVSEEQLQARRKARRLGRHPFPSKLTERTFDRFNLNLESTREAVMAYCGVPGRRKPWSQETHQAMATARREAQMLGNGRVGTGHMLLGLLQNPGLLSVFRAIEFPEAEIRDFLKRHNRSDNEVSGSMPRLTPAARRLLQRAATGSGLMIQPTHIFMEMLPDAPQPNAWPDRVKRWRAKLLAHFYPQDDPATAALRHVGLTWDEFAVRVKPLAPPDSDPNPAASHSSLTTKPTIDPDGTPILNTGA